MNPAPVIVDQADARKAARDLSRTTGVPYHAEPSERGGWRVFAAPGHEELRILRRAAAILRAMGRGDAVEHVDEAVRELAAEVATW